MTALLASVTGTAEARLALAAGVDIIDLKDPRQGALGALALPTLRAVVAEIDGRLPLSATIGDLPTDPVRIAAAAQATAATGVDLVKIGFFTADAPRRCLPALHGLAQTCALVAVLFADREPPLDRLEAFAGAGFKGLMLDTADKASGRLPECIDSGRLQAFVARARQLGLFVGLAGSLRATDVPALLALNPDYLGFRGALCVDGRRGQTLDATRLRQIRQAMPRAGTVAPPRPSVGPGLPLPT